MSDGNKGKYYDLLKLEYSLISERIEKIDLGFNSIQNIPFMLFTGIIAILISITGNEAVIDKTSSINIDYLFLMLPYLIFTLYYHIIKYTIKIFKLAGYKKSIEIELNKIAEKNALLFEAFDISQSHFHQITGGLYVGFLGLSAFLLTIYLEVIASINLYGLFSFKFIFFNSLIVLNIAFFVFLIWNLKTVAQKTHEMSIKYFRQNYSIKDESNPFQPSKIKSDFNSAPPHPPA